MIELSEADLRACCGSSRWVAAMVAAQPFADAGATYRAADDCWSGLGPDDWLEAFAAHPKIGAQKASGFSSAEQAGVAGAARDTLDALAVANASYDDKFGFVFLICATGRSADEMLSALQARLDNDRDTELRNAAEEQRNITRLRIAKLIEAPT